MYIFAYFKEPRSYCMWIGMSDLKKEGAWIWNSNNPVTYTNWNAGEPNGGTNENCGHYINNLATWNDIFCDFFQPGQQTCELILHGSS
jgi:hypothetical protein